MLTEVMEFYGFAHDFHTAGYYETEHHRQVGKEVRAAINAGRLVAVTGMVGCGKTRLLRRLQDELVQEGKVLVSKSLAVDQERTTLHTLIAALFYDLSPEKEVRIPVQGERRERDLRDLIRRGRKPVVLFVDEAHDLHSKTLTGLKRLMEVIADGGGMLSVVLVGHPKLRNDLRRPTMEEIGYRSAVFAFDGLAGGQRDYIGWLLTACAADGVAAGDMMMESAIALLAGRLRTPLQIEQHLTLAFEEGFRIGEKPVTTDAVEAVLSRQLDDLEPKLTRHGYDVHNLAEQFNAKPAEIRRFLRGELDAARTRELTDEMLAAGLPI
jgi:type II secretory pathway predicted ATPase ExeA